MTHNDVLRSLRYLLNISEAKCLEILADAGLKLSRPELVQYLKREDEMGFEPCPDPVLAHFLEGLIYFKRGKDETRPAPPLEIPVTNNTILKKIRVAFQLKDQDLIRAIQKPGVLKISKTELSAFFRNPGHRNFRPCGDQYLRNLLKGLT